MDDELDWYCQVFVDFRGSAEALARLIADITSGRADVELFRWRVQASWGQTVIEDNDEYDASRCNERDTGFLYYRWYLEIDPKTGVSRQEYLAGIGQLLQGLWAHELPAVPVGRFEEELPRQGVRGQEVTDEE